MASINLGRVVGYSAYEVAVQNGFVGTEDEWLESLKGKDGDVAAIPFKGWFSSSELLPPNPVVGDYAYVKGAESTDPAAIYECTTAGTWSDSGRTVDTSNEQTFASGEEVNETYIDDTHLVNPKDGALPTAEDVMQLKAKLEGVTAEEVKVDSSSMVTVTSKLIKGSDGGIKANNYANYAIVPISGYDVVRFNGYKLRSGLNGSSDGDVGYAFGTYSNSVWSPTSSTNFIFNSTNATVRHEYTIAIPEGATHFAVTSKFANMQYDKFYVYLKRGVPAVGKDYVDFVRDNLQVNIDDVENDLNERIDVIGGKETKEYKTEDIINDTYFYITGISGCFYNSSIETNQGFSSASIGSIVSKNNSTGYGIKSLYDNGYKSIVITTGTVYNTYLTFLKKWKPDTAKTVKELFDEGYLCDIHKENNNPVISIPPSEVEYEIPQDCRFIFFTKRAYNVDGSSANRLPSKITLVKHEHVDGTIDELRAIVEELAEKESDNGNSLKLVIKDGKCFTEPIPLEKGFNVILKEPYCFTNAYLIDHLTGNIVNDSYVTATASSSKSRRHCSDMSKIPGIDVVYQIERTDNSVIESSDGIVEEFALVEDLYTRKLPSGIDASIYRAFIEKVQSSIGNIWVPSLQAARKIPRSGGNTDTNRYKRGLTYIGVNYSGPTEWGKHVGLEVSMRTFKTAVDNPRSVMYTERIDGSGPYDPNNPYGFTHNSFTSEAGAYYGCVCTGFTSYLLGLNSVIPSSAWKVQGTSWGSSIFNVIMQGNVNSPNDISYNGNNYSYNIKEDCNLLAEVLQPMDFIWITGHCAVISAIYVDEWGEVKYIVVSEETSPTSRSVAYTPEYLFQRFKNAINSNLDWQILRKKTAWTIGEASIPRTGQDKEFVVMNNSQYNPENMGKVDKDITTFSGEGAVFVIGDYSDTTNNFKMFLNVHRGGSDGYNYIQLFNESDDEATATPIGEIDIATNGGNVEQSNILDVDAATEEDWIKYNLAEYWRVNQPNNTGKFKTRVVRKESNSVVSYSGCTHFEFVKIEVSIDTTTNNFGFVAKGGTPVQYRIESANGLIAFAAVKNLTPSDYTTEDDVHTGTNLTIPSSWPSGYIRLFVKTDYGMANRRIAYTKPTN